MEKDLKFAMLVQTCLLKETFSVEESPYYKILDAAMQMPKSVLPDTELGLLAVNFVHGLATNDLSDLPPSIQKALTEVAV